MYQRFVNRVIGLIGRLELLPASQPPSVIVFNIAPMEHHLNIFARRYRGCDLERNRNLAVRHEFASEISSLHVAYLS